MVRNIEYNQTPERLRIRHGVLNKVSDDVELYRVKDFQVQEPLYLRIFGLSNVVLLTSDKLQPRVTLRAIEDGSEVKDFIREHVEYMRQKRGVRQFD
ncbi:PH domain-containing protein [Nostoc sp. CHAB 5834]|nr:PH domain-containing protein [Nostoc sp. CHAB 5834]